MRFFLDPTQHIPPKVCQDIRRYGLHAAFRGTARLASGIQIAATSAAAD